LWEGVIKACSEYTAVALLPPQLFNTAVLVFHD
jgi:hypothetical protein